jgi:hypothetical protein
MIEVSPEGGENSQARSVLADGSHERLALGGESPEVFRPR